MYLCGMKVVIDDKIPYIREAVQTLGVDAVYKKGSEFTPEDVKDADALIVRTRTRCDEALLAHSAVKFIATATIGYDHIDVEYLKRKGVAWTNCPGCNAPSVAQYVKSCVLLLARERDFDMKHAVVGIVGAGHVGQAVGVVLLNMGMKVLFNDPPRQAWANAYEDMPTILSHVPFVSMEEIQEQCDLISFHTPLVESGSYPTFHLADEAFFQGLKQRPVIINSSRGAVVDNKALLAALHSGQVRDVVMDTWEHEPHINEGLLHEAYIATPHIAGYSADGKANASRMALTALCRFFHLQPHFTILPPELPAGLRPTLQMSEEEVALCLYNPHRDSDRLKQRPELFEELRGNYPLRREK